MKKAIFLDRDGTLNKEKEYLYQEKDLEFEEGVIEALSIFRDLGYLLIVVTNQSGIARQYYTEEDLNILDRKSTRLNSSHANISYAVFCLKKKNKKNSSK